jgi:hypothetical protein
MHYYYASTNLFDFCLTFFVFLGFKSFFFSVFSILIYVYMISENISMDSQISSIFFPY